MAASDFHLEPATAHHAAELARTMRPSDVAELSALGWPQPLEALCFAVKHFPAWTVVLGDDVAAMFGIFGDGLLWCLSGEVVNQRARAFLRASRQVVDMLLDVRPEWVADVDARYAASIRWLKWLGFEVGEARPMPPSGLPFHRATLRRS